jgi:protein involved in polysaccharide export with SLBB domain
MLSLLIMNSTSESKHRVYGLAIVLMVIGLSGVSSSAQSQADVTSLSGTGESESVPSAGTSIAMPADQIIQLLHEKPELVVELKRVAVDRLNAQGMSVQEDSITDEMLFSRISTDAQFRSSITVWLRSRGYLSDADLQAARSRAADPDEETASEYTLSKQALAGLPPDSYDRASQSVGAERDLPTPVADVRRDYPGTKQPPIRGTRPSVPDVPDANDARASQVLHRPAPYNLTAMRDLYSQVPAPSSSLRRFGSEVFLSRGMGGKETTLDIPIGPDYILGPGDGVNIDLWGGLSQRFTKTIDREGTVVLPEVGPVVLAGLTLERAQTMIQNALGTQFKNARVEVTVTRLRTIRIYVVGDVQRPGAYDLSSLSTPLNALYAAGGPTAIGSLRIVRHLRGKQLVREVDLYDFFLHGVRPDTERLQPGDTILVPPAGTQITVAGMVKRPAIYELKSETQLSQVLDLAGGLLVSAAMGQIKVERIEAHENRVTVSVNFPEGGSPDALRRSLASFVVQDGDHVMVAPILPYSERAIYLEGHVVRPGKYPYRDDMTLTDLIHSYQDLLPEPAERAVLLRLRPPDYRPETIEFTLSEALIGNDPIHLQPFDTVRIYSRYEVDPPKVKIEGEIAEPGSYPLPEGMTAAQLVRMAGGFKRSALLTEADLVSYEVKGGKKVVSHRATINIGRAVIDKDSSADVILKPGDILIIHQLSGWNDMGASMTLQGEVTYPGLYGIQEGEKLSSVLKRAGGFRSTAYPTGAVLVRAQVRELEEKSRTELVRQIENTSAGAKFSPTAAGAEGLVTMQLIAQQQQQVLQKLRSEPPSGRLVIKISTDIASWENTPADIEMRAGDVLTIPKKPSFILVSGQVYNAAAITYVPGKTAGWYLKRAGGPTDMANHKEIFVIRANGSVVGRHSGDWYDDNVLSTMMQPGDIVVVPQKIIGGSMVWRNMLATAQVLSSIAITAKVAGL